MPDVEQLYREVGPALLAYFRARSSLAGVAEDLLQDTFIQAFRRPERLSASISPRAYLFGIARHLGLNALRRTKPSEELSPDLPAEPGAPPSQSAELHAAIDTLPELHREALLLKLQQDLSYEEIAQALGIPVGTVRSRLHNAIIQLRSTLNPPSSFSPVK